MRNFKIKNGHKKQNKKDLPKVEGCLTQEAIEKLFDKKNEEQSPLQKSIANNNCLKGIENFPGLILQVQKALLYKGYSLDASSILNGETLKSFSDFIKKSELSEQEGVDELLKYFKETKKIFQSNKKPKITLLIDTPDWAFSNIANQIKSRTNNFDINIVAVKNLYSINKTDWAAYFIDSDLILAFWWGLAHEFLRYFPKNIHWGCGVFDLASLTEAASLDVLEKSDFLFLANKNFLKIAKDLFIKKRLYLTEDGVDLELFKNINPIKKDDSLKLLWAGNSDHGNNTKKYADLKGCNLILKPLSEYMQSKGAELLFLDRAKNNIVPHDKMVDWYNKVDGVLCASMAEGTPNGVLEAAACGRLCITTNVGLIPELIEQKNNGIIVDRSLENFKEAVDYLIENREKVISMGESAYNKIKKFSWEKKVIFYYNLFENEIKLIKKSDDTTVFIITVGLPQKEKCIENIQKQETNFKTKIIKNISPMNKAFQQMIDTCDTEFFIQVDEDMYLNKDAVQTMISHMQKSEKNIGMIVYPLFDPHLDIIIQGVKIYRSHVMKMVGFEDAYSCEVPIIEKMAKLGYTFEQLPLEPKYVLGIHDIGTDSKVVYERYFRLAQKWKRFGYVWVQAFAKKLKDKVRTGNGDDRDFWALSGFIAGSAIDMQQEKEADFNEVPKGFREINKMLW